MSNISFAPGETNVKSSKFSPSVIMFWLKTEIAVTSTRVVSKAPNTLFGLIPLGYKDSTYPLKNVAGVGVEVKFSVARALFGIIFLIIGANFTDNFFGWVLIILALSMILNALNASLKIQNNGGGTSEIKVSILEKSKLEDLRDEINHRLFADHDRLRHDEAMNVSNASLQAQHAQLLLQQQQQMHQQNQQGQQQQPPQTP